MTSVVPRVRNTHIRDFWSRHAYCGSEVWARCLLSHPTPWEDHKCFRIYGGYQDNEGGRGSKEDALSQTLMRPPHDLPRIRVVVLRIFICVNLADLFFFTRANITCIDFERI